MNLLAGVVGGRGVGLTLGRAGSCGPAGHCWETSQQSPSGYVVEAPLSIINIQKTSGFLKQYQLQRCILIQPWQTVESYICVATEVVSSCLSVMVSFPISACFFKWMKKGDRSHLSSFSFSRSSFPPSPVPCRAALWRRCHPLTLPSASPTSFRTGSSTPGRNSPPVGSEWWWWWWWGWGWGWWRVGCGEGLDVRRVGQGTASLMPTSCSAVVCLLDNIATIVNSLNVKDCLQSLVNKNDHDNDLIHWKFCARLDSLTMWAMSMVFVAERKTSACRYAVRVFVLWSFHYRFWCSSCWRGGWSRVWEAALWGLWRSNQVWLLCGYTLLTLKCFIKVRGKIHTLQSVQEKIFLI